MKIEHDVFVGIDPGFSGAIAVLHEGGLSVCKLDTTLDEVTDFVNKFAVHDRPRCLLERVASRPAQSSQSTFTFGRSFGQCEAIAAAFNIPIKKVTPYQWQRMMKCLTGGKKSITKAKAQELYPGHKIINATADAILLATLCRDRWCEL